MNPRSANPLTILKWLPSYDAKLFQSDVVAGLTVGVMLIPQGMAYAVLAGVSPIYGLYASVIPLLVYPLFGSSRHVAVGIVAIDCLIVAAAIGPLAARGSGRYLELVFLLALTTGVIQLAMGVLRFGFVVNLLSRPVILGFTAAAAITIGLSQVGNLTGIDISHESGPIETIAAALTHPGGLQLPTALIGLVGILFLILLRKRFPLIPAPLMLVLAASLILVALEAPSVRDWFGLQAPLDVRTVGSVPAGLPSFAFPAIGLNDVRDLLPAAITLSLVQFMSLISLGKVFASRGGYRIDANRELISLGAMNVVGSHFKSLPVSSSFSRSAVSEQSGAQTALANTFAAVIVALSLLFLTPLFKYLPIPALGAIIIVGAFGLINAREVRFLLQTKLIDGIIAVVTFAATLVLGIQQGVLIGIACSVVAILYRISRPNIAVLGHVEGSQAFRNVEVFPDARQIEGILMLRVDASFSFANADHLYEVIATKARDKNVRAVVIDASSINDLDTTALDMIEEMHSVLNEDHVELDFAGAKEGVMHVLRESGVLNRIGREHFHLNLHRAVRSILTDWNREVAYLDRLSDHG